METIMMTMDVRIEELKPMRVGRVRVKSARPEMEAWTRLKEWAEPKGFLSDLDSHPVFGYTCQLPAKDEKEYGYELWIKIDAETEAGGEVKEQMFEGGWYAVATHHGPPSPAVWKSLWDWVQASPYRWRRTHELERPRNPLAPEHEMVFDLYLPIEAPK
jgi:DNA gyrase inhibitor GyrI